MAGTAEEKRKERLRKDLGQIHKRVWVNPEHSDMVDAMAAEAEQAVRQNEKGEK